jgi:hexosaminidase
MRKLGVLLVVAEWCVSAADHRALLPYPQEISYASGSLAVRGVSIRFASTPSAEDRFAAQQLAAGLSAAGQTQIAIGSDAVSGRSIVLRRTGENAPLPGPDEAAGPASRETYTVTVTPQGAEIRAPSSAGIFYGVQTLLQMVEGTGSQAVLPAAEARDWPSLAYRGFMMDASHGQRLRVEEMERQIDMLARFKANQYYLYSEASVELEGYSLVNPDGRYSQEEIRRLIGYARLRHVDIVPCLELYGHLHDLFRVERFSTLALPRYGREFDPRNPHVLEVLDDLVDQTTKLFPSPWYHIGFDEPWALGKIGVDAGADPFATYIDVLRHVAERAQKNHKRVLFWADVLNGARIFSKHPELVAKLPKGTIAVPWDYEDRPDFTGFIEPLAQASVPTVVATGIWNWNEIFPDYHRTFKNINGLLASGRKFGTLGILNTGWADSAQAIYRPSLPGLALGAVAGWQPAPVNASAYFAGYASQVYPAAVAADVAPALEELSSAEEIFIKVLEGPTIHGFWADPLDPERLKRSETHEEELHRARLLANSAEERLRRALRAKGDPATLRSLLLGARMFDYLAMKNIYAVEWSKYFRQLRENPTPELVSLLVNIQIATQDHGMLADLMDAITGLRESYREAWLEESVSYRLGTALARWDAECEYWRAMQARIPEVLRERKPGDPFPSLEALRPRRSP